MSAEGATRPAPGRRSAPATRRRIPFARLSAVLVLLFTTACVSEKSLFYWGHYENTVYDMCHSGGTFDLTQDIQLLSQDIARAQAEGMRVAPGVHAHLGYLYYLSGNTGATLQQFNAEKELYPESATFIDGMIRRLKS
jgi:hypothetical protein